MYLDTLRNQVISSNTVENPKSRIRKKVKLKIPAKAKLIDNSITLENPSKSKRYLKIDCLQFDFLIQVGQPRYSIVIWNVLCLNWKPVVCFCGARYWKSHIDYCSINNNNNTPILVWERYWKSHIVCCGINKKNNTPILVQSIEVKRFYGDIDLDLDAQIARSPWAY